MRERIGLPFYKDCKGSNPTDFSKNIKNKLTTSALLDVIADFSRLPAPKGHFTA